MRGEQQKEWMQKLDKDYDNLRAAMETAIDMGEDQLEVGMLIANSMRTYWQSNVHLGEGRYFCTMLLQKSAAMPDLHLRMALQITDGILAWGQGDFYHALAQYRHLQEKAIERNDQPMLAEVYSCMGLVTGDLGNYREAAELYNKSLGIRRVLKDTAGEAHCLCCMGHFEHELGREDDARFLIEEGLGLQRRLGDRNSMAYTINTLGNILCNQGHFEDAMHLYRESLSILEDLGDYRGVAHTLFCIAGASLRIGKYEEAMELMMRSREMMRSLGDRGGLAMVLQNIGMQQQEHNDFKASAASFSECLSLSLSTGYRLPVMWALQGCSLLMQKQGKFVEAVRFSTASKAMSAAAGIATDAGEEQLVGERMKQMQKELGEQEYVRHAEEAAALTLEQAVAEALAALYEMQ